jgi:translation elongation factor EF-Tu-like GTPase
VRVELFSPVALERGRSITLRESGKTVAAGTMLSILR